MGGGVRTTSGNDWLWVSTRFAIYARDGFRCVACQRSESLSIDHVHPKRGNRPTNLVTLCKPCNSRKGARTIRRWRPELVDEVLVLLASPLDRKLGRELAIAAGRGGRIAQHAFRNSPAERARRAAKRQHDEDLAIATFEAFCEAENQAGEFPAAGVAEDDVRDFLRRAS